MKHHELGEQLAEQLQEQGLSVPADLQHIVLQHVLWLLAANERINLTAVTSPADAVRLHAVDSLAVLPEIVEAPRGRLLDIGTGGGFPGLPLAVSTGRPCVLLDSVGKKADALSQFVSSLDRDISVVALRAEDFGREHGGEFAVVVARAVASLASLVELAAPLLQNGGHLASLKGRLDPEELAEGDRAARIVGLTRIRVREYTLASGGELRAVVVYAKTGAPAVPLPRRVGLAQKRPLG